MQEKQRKVYIMAAWYKMNIFKLSAVSKPVLWMRLRVCLSIFLFASFESSLLPYNKYWSRKFFEGCLVGQMVVTQFKNSIEVPLASKLPGEMG